MFEVKVDLALHGCTGIEGHDKICSSRIDTTEECLLGEGWPLVCPKMGSRGKQFVQVGLASPVFDCANRGNLLQKLGDIKNLFPAISQYLSIKINPVFTDVTDTSCFMEWAQNCSKNPSQGCQKWAGKQYCRAKKELMALNDKEEMDKAECNRMEELIEFMRDYKDKTCKSIPEDCSVMEDKVAPVAIRKVVKKVVRKDGRS